MLKELTIEYIKAFNKRNLKDVAFLLDDSFVLKDPVVKKIEGKDKCLEAINNIFTSCKKLEFSAKNIYRENNTTFIEFILLLDNVMLEGVDIIEWKNDKIQELRAYLDIPKD